MPNMILSKPLMFSCLFVVEVSRLESLKSNHKRQLLHLDEANKSDLI